MRKAFKPLALLAASAAFVTTPAIAQETAESSAAQPTSPHPMTALDLVTMPRLGGPSVNDDGTLALYSVTTTDSESLARSTQYRARTIATGDEVTVTMPEGASSPVFVGDDEVYFLAPGGEGSTGAQVWRGALRGDGTLADLHQVTQLTREVGGFEVSPNGESLAIFGNVPRGCAQFDCPDAAATATGSGRRSGHHRTTRNPVPATLRRCAPGCAGRRR